MAESGHQVLVVSADLRRPRIHELLGVAGEPGITDLPTDGGISLPLDLLHRSSEAPGVHVVPSGAPVHNPSPYLSHLRAVIAVARERWDFILLDTPPVLVANDASELAQFADAVVVVGRAGRTRAESADRASDVLRRVDAPALGVVLTDVPDRSNRSDKYTYRYRSESHGKARKDDEPRRGDDGAESFSSAGSDSQVAAWRL
jgi:Mrp family chromosome partitioning ATPase